MILPTVTSIVVLALANLMGAEAADAGRNLQYYYYYSSSYYYYYSPSSYYYSSYYYYDSTYYSDAVGTAAKVATGAIVGIVIGVVVCVAIVVFVIVWFCCTRKVLIDGQMKRECKCCPKKHSTLPGSMPGAPGPVGYPTATYANTTMVTQPMMTTQPAMVVQQPGMMVAQQPVMMVR